MKTLEIINVSKKYKKNVVLSDVSLKFEEGKCYMVVGGNGAGKSTLLKIIIGLIRPEKGEVKKNNISIGYVPEKYSLPDYIKVKEYLYVLGNIRKISKEKLNTVVDENLKDWGMYQYKDYKLKQLSKGMLQKIVIIQALFHNPDLYIFDEALNGLDINMQEKLLEIIKKLKENNKIVIITSHYPKIYEKYIDIIYHVKNHKIEMKVNNYD